MSANKIRVVCAGETLCYCRNDDEVNEMARERGLDAEQVSEDPPVWRLADLGRESYAKARSARNSRRASKRPPLKVIQLRPTIATADLSTKMRQAIKFINKGHPVKFELRLRGARQKAAVDTFKAWFDDNLAEFKCAFHQFEMPAVAVGGGTLTLTIGAGTLTALEERPPH